MGLMMSGFDPPRRLVRGCAARISALTRRGEFVPLWLSAYSRSICSSRRTRQPTGILLVAPVSPSGLDALLQAVRDGQVSPADARARLAGYATEDLGFATIDHAREARTGWPEVVFGAGKTPAQVAAIG